MPGKTDDTARGAAMSAAMALRDEIADDNAVGRTSGRITASDVVEYLEDREDAREVNPKTARDALSELERYGLLEMVKDGSGGSTKTFALPERLRRERPSNCPCCGAGLSYRSDYVRIRDDNLLDQLDEAADVEWLYPEEGRQDEVVLCPTCSLIYPDLEELQRRRLDLAAKTGQDRQDDPRPAEGDEALELYHVLDSSGGSGGAAEDLADAGDDDVEDGGDDEAESIEELRQATGGGDRIEGLGGE